MGTVLAHLPDGTSRVQYPGSGTEIVRGQDVEVGLKAFVQGGQIQGEAPNLPQETVEI